MNPYNQILTVLGKYCPLSSLPTDVFIDNIIVLLDVEDIIRLRMVSRLAIHASPHLAHLISRMDVLQVNKVFLTITEEPSIWKRLLARTTFPLPPLPPCSRYALQGLTGLEAERLLTRAISFDKVWRQICPPYLDEWNASTEFDINSMVIVPGGRYLVASVREAANIEHQIVVYILDHEHGLVPIASLPTKSKAYQLQARYVNVPVSKDAEDNDDLRQHGGGKRTRATSLVPGIAISYICSRPKNHADAQTYVLMISFTIIRFN